jgi:hypothetical protein
MVIEDAEAPLVLLLQAQEESVAETWSAPRDAT